MIQEPVLGPRRQSTGMRVLRIAVLVADALSLLAVLLIRFFFPLNSGQDGEAAFWAGLLLAYALILLFGLTLVLNIVYLIVLAFMCGRYDNGYTQISDPPAPAPGNHGPGTHSQVNGSGHANGQKCPG